MLRLDRITVTFGATVAVDEVSLDIRPGSITAVVGENGAGKTTLMRVAAGEILPRSGTVETSGNVELVHQHFMLVDDFTIAENLALSLGTDRIIGSSSVLAREAERIIASTGIEIGQVTRRVADLSVGEKARLELVKAIARRPGTIVLDEPTAVLTPLETGKLFDVMRRLRSDGVGVVLISHKLPEVLASADRIVVMRRGRLVLDVDRSAADLETITRAMVERDTSRSSRLASPSAGAPVLVAERLAGKTLDDVSLTVRAGEIAAIVGVAGNGQKELAAILRGLERPRSGTLRIDASRVAHIPEDRTRDGIVGEMSIAENVTLTSRRWSRRASRVAGEDAIARYSIRATGAAQRAGDLSGGNQQKVILARELETEPRLIVAAEPTRGLDFDAAAFVHRRLHAAAAGGAAILLITSDLDEAFALATAVHVIYRGRLSQRLAPEEAHDRVASLMAGVW